MNTIIIPLLHPLQQVNQLPGGPLWDADILARAAAHLNAALSNFTCVLESINAVSQQSLESSHVRVWCGTVSQSGSQSVQSVSQSVLQP